MKPCNGVKLEYN